MFDFGFSEVLLIFVIALVVLGPEKLPRLASQVGRWVGRARSMARQFREQLEEEVNLEQVRKAHNTAAAEASKPTEAHSAVPDAQTTASQAESAPHAASDTGTATHQTQPAATPFDGTGTPKPEEFRPDTFSHAHPTNEYGANPLTPNGAAEPQTPAAPAPEAIQRADVESRAATAEDAPHDPEPPSASGAYAGTTPPVTAGESPATPAESRHS